MIDPRSFSFEWPWMLWLLLIVPFAALWYARALARRRQEAQRWANLESVSTAAGRAGAIRRHVPPLLLLIGLCAMILAIARPHASVVVPSRAETVMLALDASGSMRATDIKPTRMSAVQAAAKTFVAGQPGNARVGIVSIAATAAVVQSPTRSREDLAKAIDRLQPQPGTAIGSGLIIALATLLPAERIDVDEVINGTPSHATLLNRWRGEEAEKPKPAAPGSNGSAVIVLLSDGQSNTGPEPSKIAQMAADRGVRIFTVGMGTTEGATVSAGGWSMRVRLDEDALKKIAATTHGEYFRAATAAELQKIYGTLSARLAVEKQRPTEVTAIFAGIGAALAMGAALLSLLWFNRIL